jgi:hypothetical protein
VVSIQFEEYFFKGNLRGERTKNKQKMWQSAYWYGIIMPVKPVLPPETGDKTRQTGSRKYMYSRIEYKK